MPKLRWRRTGLPPDRGNDYVGEDPGVDMFARVYLTDSHPAGAMWYWGVGVHPRSIGSGFEREKQAAVDAAQACYDRFMAKSKP